MSKLEVAVLIGAESKQFLADLTAIVDRLEAAIETAPTTTKPQGKYVAKNEDEVPNEKPAKKVAKKIEAEEESFDLGSEDAAGEDEAPAVTKKDLIAACRDNRETAIKVLKKLKVNSVHELKPAQYAKVMAEIGA